MKIILLSFLVIFFYGCAAFQQNELWSEEKVTKVENESEMPDRYRVFQLNEDSFSQKLEKVGSSKENAIILSLPDPNGQLKNFLIWKAKTVNASLLKKFPNLQTYQGVSNKTDIVKVRMEKSVDGFQMMVIDKNDTWFLKPLKNNPNRYITFFKKDLRQGVKSFWHDKVIN